MLSASRFLSSAATTAATYTYGLVLYIRHALNMGKRSLPPEASGRCRTVSGEVLGLVW